VEAILASFYPKGLDGVLEFFNREEVRGDPFRAAKVANMRRHSSQKQHASLPCGGGLF
jgi:hypothetical protein